MSPTRKGMPFACRSMQNRRSMTKLAVARSPKNIFLKLISLSFIIITPI